MLSEKTIPKIYPLAVILYQNVNINFFYKPKYMFHKVITFVFTHRQNDQNYILTGLTTKIFLFYKTFLNDFSLYKRCGH